MIDYVVSDLHLGHENIIDLCSRPFDTVEEMDETLISNWNTKVSEDDTVLFLGDLALGTKREQKEYLEKLSGDIIFVSGNHDSLTMNTEDCIPIYEALDFEVSGIQFYATHYPEDIPNFRWLLHGHVHNNDRTEYPLYNPNDNRVNLSIEMIEYEPLEMEELISIIKTENQTLYTISDR